MRIYPLSELKKAPSPLVDQLGGNSVTIVFDRKSKAARVRQDGMSGVVWFVSFLDDLKTFYPDAEIYRAARRRM